MCKLYGRLTILVLLTLHDKTDKLLGNCYFEQGSNL